mgnify:CR=1 FL=1
MTKWPILGWMLEWINECKDWSIYFIRRQEGGMKNEWRLEGMLRNECMDKKVGWEMNGWKYLSTKIRRRDEMRNEWMKEPFDEDKKAGWEMNGWNNLSKKIRGWDEKWMSEKIYPRR